MIAGFFYFHHEIEMCSKAGIVNLEIPFELGDHNPVFVCLIKKENGE